MNMERALIPAAAAMIAIAGTAIGQNVDGSRDASYGAPLTTQGSRVIDIVVAGPIDGAIQTNNANTGGVDGFLGGDFDGPVEEVLTGLEFVIPAAELDWDGTSPIQIAAFINGQGHDFMSNQIVGSLDNDQFAFPGNPGEPRNIDFGDSIQFPGDQFREIPLGGSNIVEPIDGTASLEYGATLWEQDVPTGFGNNTNADQFEAGGSEFNALRAFRDDLGTPSTADDLIYVHLAGNLQTNFNKIDVFFDVKAGGQNRLRDDNADISFNGLNRMGDDGSGNGVTFDADFAPDYYFTFTNGLGGGGAAEEFASSAVLFTDGDPNSGDEMLQAGNFLAGGASASGPYTGTGPNGLDISFQIDNSNVLGVSSPGGGVGGDVDPVSDPATVDTGVEFAINLDQIGYDDNGEVAIAGFFMFSGWDFFSNQVIGGLPADTNSLGSPASDKTFRDSDPAGIPGDQFVTVAVPPMPSTVMPAIDGSLEASYGAPLFVNQNSTSFGDNTNIGIDNANGSEIDAVYAQVVLNPEGERLLYVFVAGNAGEFHRLVTYYDVRAGGQNPLRGDNPDIDFNGLNNMEGFTFDDGFEPDFALGYHLGFNENTNSVQHFFDAAELLTLGAEDPAAPALGGRFAGGTKTSAPLAGSIVVKDGFADNTLGGGADRFNANGSELAAAYARVGNLSVPGVGNVPSLFLMLTGNLEPNGNKLEIFFDVDPTVGQDTLIYDDPENPNGYAGNPIIEFGDGGSSDALNRMGGPFPIFLLDEFGEPVEDEEGNPIVVDTLPGLTFDDGFTADYWASFELFNFDAAIESVTGQLLFARLRGVDGPADPGDGRFVGSTTIASGFLGLFTNGTLGPDERIRAFADNSNTAGVPGGDNPFIDFASIDGPTAAATTGVEIAIPLADLNWDGESNLRLQAFINGQQHDFVSNQHLQFACTGDLGEPRLVNFNDLEGLQYLELERDLPGNNFDNISPRPEDCTAPPACPGDLDGNLVVDALDLGILLGAFGSSDAGDLNDDGVTDALDLGILLGAFGVPCE